MSSSDNSPDKKPEAVPSPTTDPDDIDDPFLGLGDWESGDADPLLKPAQEEDKRASRLVKWESGARTLESISRHVATLAMRLLLTGTAICLVVKPDLVPWLKDLLGGVLKDAWGSGYGFAVPLVVAVTVFRKELTRLFSRRP